MYVKRVKRALDFCTALTVLLVLSPLFLALTVIGAFAMKGNPFFVQRRPGWHEEIFSLIKFRSMTDARGVDGRPLPDAERLTRYGRFLRTTSLDELPELLNILRGDLSFVGPRPLLIEYLPWYSETERRRHEVRPGLTGWAQVNGRNRLPWDERFRYDVAYVDGVSFRFDLRIIARTVRQLLRPSDVSDDIHTVEPNFARQRQEEKE